MKFCVNCEHCVIEQDKYGTLYLCDAWLDCVTGESFNMQASLMRSENRQCGPDGKLFKRKQITDDRFRTDMPELR